MRRIVRYCAGCLQQDVHTELAESEPDVVVIIDRYGAITDLCGDCQQRLLGPVLEVMATGEDLHDLKLTDWAKLGQQRPTRRTARGAKRKPHNDPPAKQAPPSPPADSEPARDAPATEFHCEVCGKQFDSASSLMGHRKHYGNRPHQAKTASNGRRQTTVRQRSNATETATTAPPETEPNNRIPTVNFSAQPGR